MRALSKSKILASLQCHKRLWLEVHRPSFRKDSAATQASFASGDQVGEIARNLYQTEGAGTLIDWEAEGFSAGFARTLEAMQRGGPVFEAGFQCEGALSLADVLLPVEVDGGRAWRMVEVKSSTSIKDYHLADAAIQSYVARSAGVPLVASALARVDSSWTYPGDGDYQGLLVEKDVTEQTLSREREVRGWIAAAQRTVAEPSEPKRRTGKHCNDPYECGFLKYCQGQEPQADSPVYWLPRRTGKLKQYIEKNGITEMRDVPDQLLNPTQQRVKTATLSGEPFFDREGAARALSQHSLPAYFMDFETIMFAVPIWAGTRPYQQIPFQFSVHRMQKSCELEHREFLDLSGNDPSGPFASALVAACGKQGPIFVYNASFETARLRELAARFPDMADDLLALNERVVDLLPIAQSHYYHASQKGSWSIKAVLPALCGQSYEKLDGVKDGGMAMAAYLEALGASTTPARRLEIDRQLREYCCMDTMAMVRIFESISAVDSRS